MNPQQSPYRYTLSRMWDATRPQVAFVMLNPSTADAHQDDPTIRRCVGFAKQWGFGRLAVVNLFAYRATRPADLLIADDPVGEDNDAHLLNACRASETIVCAWGNHGAHRGRDAAVCALLEDFPLMCLGLTQRGQPRHPLYVGYAQPLLRFG